MDEMRAALLENGHIILGVPFIIGLFIVVLSSKRPAPTAAEIEKINGLEKELSRLESYSFFSFIVFTPIISFFVWRALKLLSELLMQRVDESVFIFPPSDLMWVMPAVVFAMFLSSLPARVLLSKVIGKGSYRDYTDYLGVKHGMNYQRLMKRMGLLVITPFLIFTCLVQDSYIRVTQDSFIVNDLLSIGEKHYSFDDIRKINMRESYVDEEGITVLPNTKIVFDDGYIYNFHVSTTQVDFKDQKLVIDYITDYFLN